MSKKLADKIKAAFSKTVDEAVAGEEKEAPAKDSQSEAMDMLVQMVKDLGAKVDKMGGAKDEKKDPPPAPVEKKTDDVEPAPEAPAEVSMEDRMKKLEMAVAAILEKMSAGDEEEEEVSDEGEEVVEDEESDEITDEEIEGEVVDTGDEMSRAEILAPGIKKTKDVKSAALKAAYKTKDGKKVIDALTAGKPDFDKAEKVDMLFISASEMLKSARSEQLSNTKKTRDSFSSAIFETEGHMTPEKMNELNAKRYGG